MTSTLERWLPRFVVVVAFGGGAALVPELEMPWVAVAATVLPVLVLLRVAPWEPLHTIGVIGGAFFVPVYVLLGVDAVWEWIAHEHPHPVTSWLIGAAIFTVASGAFVGRIGVWKRVVLTIAPAHILVILLPVFVFAAKTITGNEEDLDQPAQAVSTLQVVVMRANGDAIDPGAKPLQGWKLQTFVARVDGERVDWGAEGSPPATLRDNTDRVLLLMPGADSRPQSEDAQRWLRLAAQEGLRRTPTYALLPAGDDAALPVWKNALDGPQRGARVLDADSTDKIDELALELATQAPSATSDLALAVAHRPVLRFDTGEKYKTPLNVDRLIKSGKLKLCEADQALPLCPSVHSSDDLHNGGTHLGLEPDELAKVTDDSTIYVNIKHTSNDRPNTVYLDYWWYLPNNPTAAGGGALCGAGFVIAGVTCFDHQSDWEGVTVALDEDKPEDPPIGVTYAQHDGSVRYTWTALERLWRGPGGDRQRFDKSGETAVRPFVFVARGRHSSYPTSCSTEFCHARGLPGIAETGALKDKSHDGVHRWREGSCAAVCVTALPTHQGGDEPARWNAFAGGWGTADCGLGFLCTSDKPPAGPAFRHARYRYPWCASETFDFAGGRFVPITRRCEPEGATGDALARGKRLVALGDSFSSGEGAGTYEPGSHGAHNSCHRSPYAWPQVLAHMRGFVKLHSLACSGARAIEVTDGDKKSDQPYRTRSQVSRIANEPNVVTLTIGGNDVGFRKVLTDCLAIDCSKKYERPGSYVERQVHSLVEKLPGVYRTVQAAAPHALVVVVDYPRLFPWEDIDESCVTFDLISLDEREYLNGVVHDLDAKIRAAALEAGVSFVDVEEAFDGRELRCGPRDYVNPPSPQGELTPASFHPTVRGYARLAAVVDRQLPDP